MLSHIAITTRRTSRETRARRRSLSERKAQYGLKRSSEGLKFIDKAPAKDSGRKSVRNSVGPEHFGAALDEQIEYENGRTKQVSIGSMTYEPFDESVAAQRAEFLLTRPARPRWRTSAPKCHRGPRLSLYAAVRPNPSIERTRSGSADLAFISFWAKPAPPPRAAHVKR